MILFGLCCMFFLHSSRARSQCSSYSGSLFFFVVINGVAHMHIHMDRQISHWFSAFSPILIAHAMYGFSLSSTLSIYQERKMRSTDIRPKCYALFANLTNNSLFAGFKQNTTSHCCAHIDSAYERWKFLQTHTKHREKREAKMRTALHGLYMRTRSEQNAKCCKFRTNVEAVHQCKTVRVCVLVCVGFYACACVCVCVQEHNDFDSCAACDSESMEILSQARHCIGRLFWGLGKRERISWECACSCMFVSVARFILNVKQNQQSMTVVLMHTSPCTMRSNINWLHLSVKCLAWDFDVIIKLMLIRS